MVDTIGKADDGVVGRGRLPPRKRDRQDEVRWKMGSNRQHRIVDDQQLSGRQEDQGDQAMDSHDDSHQT